MRRRIWHRLCTGCEIVEQEERTPSGPPDKDPDEWSTGDERMTGPQASYLRTLSREAGEPFDETLTKAQASKRIDELQAKTGRGRERQG